MVILIFVGQKQQNTSIPEIWETEEERKLSIVALKKKYIAFARSRFIYDPPKKVVNNDTDWPIEISNRVVNEWWGKSRTRERILAIRLLDVMLEGAQYVKTVEDNKNTPGIENVSYFINSCKINGKPYEINITVKKMSDNNRRFVYYYAATNSEKRQ